MNVKCLPVGYLRANCYVIADEETKACAVIDPGGNPEIIRGYIEEMGYTCEAILLTHAHDDHSQGLVPLKEALGCPCYMHMGDKGLKMRRRIKGGYEMYACFPEPEDMRWCKEGDVIQVGKLELEILETPGHTMGGITIRCLNALFPGDTLFKLSTGRADLGGDMETEIRSLKKLAMLPGDYDVYPGHGEATTLQFERDRNPWMKQAMKLE